MIVKKNIIFSRYFVFLSIFFVMLPIHITFDSNFDIYLNRTASWWRDGFYVSIPIGAFWLCFGFLYLSLIRPKVIVIPTLIILSYLGILFLVDVFNFRFVANAAGFLYFFLCVRLFNLFATYHKLSELNGWSIYGIWSLLALVIHFFPQFFIFNVYGFSQYVSTLMASFVIGFFFLKNTSILSRIILSIIFYISMQYALQNTNSTYVSASLVLAILFYGIYFFLKSMKFEESLIFHSLFWFVNLLYLVFLTLPYDFGFKNRRDDILMKFLEHPESLIIPFFKNEMTFFYSSHSFFTESFRTFGVLSIFVLFFMLRGIINLSNLPGTMIATHAFVVIGLFAMPQLHFYTIPLIVLLPLLNWSTLPFSVRH